MSDSPFYIYANTRLWPPCRGYVGHVTEHGAEILGCPSDHDHPSERAAKRCAKRLLDELLAWERSA